jgi:dihydropyrimidinase
MTTALVHGGTVVNADLSERADVLIKHGKIIAVGLGLTGDTIIYAVGYYVMPSGIEIA